MKLFYLFTWFDYEFSGLPDAFAGSYTTLEEAMSKGDMSENAEILEIKPDGLWRVAVKHDGWPPKWEMVGEKLK